jgi:hypothetical protein
MSQRPISQVGSPWRSPGVRFQLTSLMDLLLIIVFAQYLEFHRQRSDALADAQHAIARAQQSLHGQLAEEAGNLKRIQDRLVGDNQRLRQQQALTEQLLKTLLQIDPSLVVAERSPQESLQTLADVQAAAAAIGQADGTQLLRFLAGHEQLLKRAEVWTVHVSDRGDTELQAGLRSGKSQSFRLEADSQAARTDEFVEQMRAAYAQVPQPKGLVVILVSYSPRAVAGNYQPVLDGMPRVIEWLSADSRGRTRFEYAVIGAITDPQRDLPLGGPP